MHSYGEKKDGVAVIGSRASAEMLLHGFHDREELLSERYDVMKHHLQGKQTRWSRKEKQGKCFLLDDWCSFLDWISLVIKSTLN